VPAKERIQKVLSAQGIGSRREVEAWIGAGRIAVNGVPAVAGQAIGPRDDVRLDGRRLRLRWDVELLPQALVYHRPAREGMRAAVEGSERSTFDRLPRPASGRWVPVSPMGLGEGGLELFVNDGALAASLMSGADRLSSEFSVRVRGEFDESRITEVVEAAARDPESNGRIDELDFAGGEAANRWARVVTTGLRPRDLKRIFEHCGIEANRILRLRADLDGTFARTRRQQEAHRGGTRGAGRRSRSEAVPTHGRRQATPAGSQAGLPVAASYWQSKACPLIPVLSGPSRYR